MQNKKIVLDVYLLFRTLLHVLEIRENFNSNKRENL